MFGEIFFSNTQVDAGVPSFDADLDSWIAQWEKIERIVFLKALLAVFEEDRTLKAMLRVVDTLAQDPEYKFSDWVKLQWEKVGFTDFPNSGLRPFL